MRPKASETLKIARGTARKDRAVKKIPLMAGRPAKPDWLSDIASEKWDETEKIMMKEGTLTEGCGDFLCMYCIAFDDFHKSSRTIDDEGEYCHSEKGGVYQHPAVGVRNKAIERINKFGKQLGLSPATSGHVQKTEPKEADSKKGRFFGKQA